MAVRVFRNTLPALLIVWTVFFIELIFSGIEHEGMNAVYYSSQLISFLAYTFLGVVTGGIGAGILARKKKKYSNYFESEQDRYHRYFFKNAAISAVAVFALTARELINHPLLYGKSLLNPSFWFGWAFVFLKEHFSPLYFSVFFVIILAMCVHNLMYNLSVYHGVKRVSLYSVTILSGVFFLFSSGYLNASEQSAGKNIILIGVENLKSAHLRKRTITGRPGFEELMKCSYSFSSCFTVSEDPRVSLLSTLTSVHPEKGGYLSGYRTYGLEKRTIFQVLKEKGYTTALFADPEFTFSKMTEDEGGTSKYPANREKLKAKVLLSHMLMPVIYNNIFLTGYFSEILLLDEYRDMTYQKKQMKKLISGRDRFVFLYAVTDHRDCLPYPYYRTGNFGNADEACMQYLDDEISEIYRTLKTAGKKDDTLICLFGIPGEDAAANCRVPLVISLPEFGLDRVVKNNYSTLDILPTVLDAAGFRGGYERKDGVSFFDPEFEIQNIILTGTTLNSGPDSVIFFNSEGYASKRIDAERELYPMIERSMVRDDYLLKVRPGKEKVSYSLYNIETDPLCRTDIIEKEPRLGSKMVSLYEEKMKKDFSFRLLNGYVLK